MPSACIDSHEQEGSGTEMKFECRVQRESWPFRHAVEIARGTIHGVDLIVVELRDEQGRVGRGEGVGVPYDAETPESMLTQVESIRAQLSATRSPDNLEALLPAGGARNALDCAYWDLRAKQAGCRAWELAGLQQVQSVSTAYTLGLDSEEVFRAKLQSVRHMPIIKIKADAQRHIRLVRIARQEHPTARLLVDANQAWDRVLLERLLPELQDLGVELVEQPLPRGQDDQLDGLGSPIPLAADESCTDSHSIEKLAGRYQYINIKLDKCGGLTEALRMVEKAKQLGLGLMVGNMAGTSLSMAPAFLLAQYCAYSDLDGPLFLREDRQPAMVYAGDRLSPAESGLWG